LADNGYYGLKYAVLVEPLKVMEGREGTTVALIAGLKGLRLLNDCPYGSLDSLDLVETTSGSRETLIRTLAVDFIEQPLVNENRKLGVVPALDRIGQVPDGVIEGAAKVVQTVADQQTDIGSGLPRDPRHEAMSEAVGALLRFDTKGALVIEILIDGVIERHVMRFCPCEFVEMTQG
jgi:hypothetical protein